MLHRTLTAFGLALTVFALVAVPGPVRADSTAGCNGFNGSWMTTWSGGTVKMVIVKGRGAYTYLGGTLTGTIASGVFSGSYSQNNGASGTFAFKLSDDGNLFDGWYASSSTPSQRSSWKGICTGPAS